MNSFITANASDAQVIKLRDYEPHSNNANEEYGCWTEEKWSPFQTLLFILLTCGAFWLTVAAIVKNIMA